MVNFVTVRFCVWIALPLPTVTGLLPDVTILGSATTMPHRSGYQPFLPLFPAPAVWFVSRTPRWFYVPTSYDHTAHRARVRVLVAHRVPLRVLTGSATLPAGSAVCMVWVGAGCGRTLPWFWLPRFPAYATITLRFSRTNDSALPPRLRTSSPPPLFSNCDFYWFYQFCVWRAVHLRGCTTSSTGLRGFWTSVSLYQFCSTLPLVRGLQHLFHLFYWLPPFTTTTTTTRFTTHAGCRVEHMDWFFALRTLFYAFYAVTVGLVLRTRFARYFCGYTAVYAFAFPSCY